MGKSFLVYFFLFNLAGVVHVNFPTIRTTNGWVEKYMDTKWADEWLI